MCSKQFSDNVCHNSLTKNWGVGEDFLKQLMMKLSSKRVIEGELGGKEVQARKTL